MGCCACTCRSKCKTLCTRTKAPWGTVVKRVKTGLTEKSPTKGKGYCGGAALCEGEGGKWYLAGSNGLAVVDVKKPRSPSVVGKNIDTGAIAVDTGVALARSGDWLYVAGGKGLQVFNVSDPARPQKHGDLINAGVIGSGGGIAMAVVGKVLYVVGTSGLVVFTIQDPKKPARVDAIIDTGVLTAVSGVAIKVMELQPAPILFIAGTEGLAAFDISDPKHPQEVSTVRLGALERWSGACLAVRDSTMYVAGGKGIAEVDISDPRDLKLVGEVVEAGALASSADAAILPSGKELMIAGGGGFMAMNAEESPLPVLKGPLSIRVLTETGPAAMAEVGGMIYVLGGRGLAVVKKEAFLK